MCIIQLYPRRVISTHLYRESFWSHYLSAVSGFDRWAVLHWCDGTASDGLALSEEVWELLAGGLFGC